MEALLGQIAVGVLVGSLTSVISVRFALRRFQREKWWERRYETYSAAIGAVAELHYRLMQEIARQGGAKHIAEFDVNNLQTPIKDVHRTVAFGGLLLSREMVAALNSLGPKLSAANADLQASAVVVRDILAEINKIARRDLSLDTHV